MPKEIKILNELINQFILGQIEADLFEDRFTEIFDFSDINESEIDFSYLQKVRLLLEHYSSSESDIRTDPDFFIDQKTLREKLVKLNL